MEQASVEQPSVEPGVEGPPEDGYLEPGTEMDVAGHEAGEAEYREREELRLKVARLEAELQRYREHAQRTSKLFLSASNFADWVRESARRDAEAALRKARARAERFGVLEEERERAEQELAHLHEELERMRALTEEARSRLSAFLTAGLQALNEEDGAESAHAGGETSAPDDLQGTLHERLGSTSPTAPVWAAGFERPDL